MQKIIIKDSVKKLGNFLGLLIYFLHQEVIDEKLHRILGEKTAEDDKKPLKKQQQKIVKIEVRMLVAFGRMQL